MEEILDTRPSDEIVYCTGCGHPAHEAGDALCGFLEQDGATECGCSAAPFCDSCLPGVEDVEAGPPSRVCMNCGSMIVRPVVREGTEDYNDLQTYLEGDSRTAMAAAKRLDQRSVDAGQMSPGAYRETHGELPDRTNGGHRLWCSRWRYHTPQDCPVWGDE